MKYVVYITEELQRGVVVEADSFREAKNKVDKAYGDEKFVLDYRDYNGTNIECDREASEWDIQNYESLEEE